MAASELPGPGLQPEQWEKVKALAVSLSPRQTMWLSGYFAGLADAAREGLEAAASPMASAAAEEPAAGERTLTVLYGGETGNSRDLAKTLAESTRAAGREAKLASMDDYKPRDLKDEQDLIVVAATHGEGDPPQGAKSFFEFLESRKAPKLPDLRFAVLALGDSTYEKFCEAGKRIDRRLEELGGTRIRERVDCDVDYDEPAAAWTAEIVSDLAEDRAAPRPTAAVAPASSQEAARHDRKNPFAAIVLDNLVLTGRGSTKETRHIEFSLEGSGLTYEPGDALGVVARNDPRLVETLLGALEIDAGAEVETKAGRTHIGEALERVFEIGVATPRFVDHWAKLSGAEELSRLAEAANAQERAAYLRERHVLDIVRDHPVKGLAPDAFVAGLRPMQPRLYSIASSLAAAPDEAHLTVSTVRYALRGEPRSGVASGHLAERAAPDATLPVYVQPNAHFRLPGDAAGVVMVGAGTGVAPYRAFLQEREAKGAEGRSWLFFGERNFRSDFLYQTEWQAWLKDGTLARMNVAFSRDGPNKVYVQDKMRAEARELYAWLEEGAFFYVCGDAALMAHDVRKALVDVVAQEAGRDREAAEDYVRGLERDRRYLTDVY